MCECCKQVRRRFNEAWRKSTVLQQDLANDASLWALRWNHVRIGRRHPVATVYRLKDRFTIHGPAEWRHYVLPVIQNSRVVRKQLHDVIKRIRDVMDGVHDGVVDSKWQRLRHERHVPRAVVVMVTGRAVCRCWPCQSPPSGQCKQKRIYFTKLNKRNDKLFKRHVKTYTFKPTSITCFD